MTREFLERWCERVIYYKAVILFGQWQLHFGFAASLLNLFLYRACLRQLAKNQLYRHHNRRSMNAVAPNQKGKHQNLSLSDRKLVAESPKAITPYCKLGNLGAVD